MISIIYIQAIIIPKLQEYSTYNFFRDLIRDFSYTCIEYIACQINVHILSSYSITWQIFHTMRSFCSARKNDSVTFVEKHDYMQGHLYEAVMSALLPIITFLVKTATMGIYTSNICTNYLVLKQLILNQRANTFYVTAETTPHRILVSDTRIENPSILN